MQPPRIVAYLNPLCPWTRGVVRFLQQHDLAFDFRDIIRDPEAYREMVARSGQHASPCVEINGHMLADVGGEEVASWMQDNGYV